MKKLSFIFAMVFAGSMAMAQNSATISATGNYNDHTIIQGVANNNIASILQVQDGDIGYPAEATITQVAGSWATITQYGHRNYATINEGTNDRAEIYQNGQVNSSLIGFSYGEGNNVGYVEQFGTYNGGYIYTTYHNNGTLADPLFIHQDGNTNSATIEAGWNAPASSYDLASIRQDGDNNISKVRQEGGDWNVARVNQSGNSDVANLTQTGGYLVATIDQTIGDANIVNLHQTGGIVDIDQNGGGNIVQGLLVGLVQDPLAVFAGATLDVWQVGNDNILDLQSTTPSAIVNVYQNGTTNAAIVIQN